MEINGVFEGGGVRGVALAGAAAATLDRGYRFHRAVGTSAGALVAALVIAGYTSQELEDEVAGLDWSRLLHSSRLAGLPVVGKHLALMVYQGVNTTDRIEDVWSRLLLRKGVTTFGDLPEGSLQVIATDLSHGAGVAFPHCLAEYGQDPGTFPVARAVVMSAAAPFPFTPVPVCDTLTGERVLFSDGVMVANYPIGVIAKDCPVIGLRLSPDGNPHIHQFIHGPYGLAAAVMTSGIRARHSLPRTMDGADKVLSVPARTDLEFSVTRHEAKVVFERARTGVLEQLDPAVSP